MQLQKILIFLIAISLYWSCGSNPAEEGEKAFMDGNYNIAIKHFIEEAKALRKKIKKDSS